MHARMYALSIFPGECGLAGCPFGFPSPIISLGTGLKPSDFHILLGRVPLSLHCHERFCIAL